MKHFLLIALVLGCVLGCTSRAYACWCVRPEVPDALKRANAVFVGEVLDIVEPKTANDDAPIQDRFFTIKFKIEKSWKGVPFGLREFNVLAAQGRYGCFAFPPMNKGERYLVYADPAYGAESWSVVTICTRTTPIRFGSNPRLLNPDAIDPFADMRMLDAITSRTFTFGEYHFQRRRV